MPFSIGNLLIGLNAAASAKTTATIATKSLIFARNGPKTFNASRLYSRNLSSKSIVADDWRKICNRFVCRPTRGCTNQLSSLDCGRCNLETTFDAGRGSLRRWFSTSSHSLRGSDDSKDTQTSSSGSGSNCNDLLLSRPTRHVAQIAIHRPKVKNAFSLDTARELIELLDELDSDPSVRCLVLNGSGADLTSGVDLKSFMTVYQQVQAVEDVGRRAKLLRSTVEKFQAPFKRLHELSKPIICVAHGLSFGLAMELLACCDIRYCSGDARMAIREVLIGIAADVGSLQLMPKLSSNQSLLNELIFTGRQLTVDEATKLGFVSKVFDTKELAVAGAIETATTIAKRSPVAVQGSKQNLRFSRDQPFGVGLDYNAIWNMAMMQSEDVPKAIGAILSRQTEDSDTDHYADY